MKKEYPIMRSIKACCKQRSVYGLRILVIITCGFFITLAAADELSAQCTQYAPKKKLILTGVEYVTLNPQFMKDLVATLGNKGVSGVSIGFNNPTSPGEYGFWSIHAGVTWKKEQFAKDIALMSAAKSEALPENFLECWISPTGSVSGEMRKAWDDDVRWKSFTDNMGVLAYVAKQGGFKGLVLDPEDYNKSKQWVFQASDGTYEATAALARQRGREMMTAIVREYPNITILCYWLLSPYHDQAIAADPKAAIKTAENHLYVPFINGMLDALPPTAKMIDATELGYWFNAPGFAPWATNIKNDCIRLVEPENKMKYRAQVQAGFGHYANRYTPDGNALPLSGSKAKRLVQNLSAALSAADEYVWLYGNIGCWKFWKPEYAGVYGLWKDLIPGFETALQFTTDLDGMGRRVLDELKTGGTATNLAANPGFEQYTGTQPTGWSTTQWIASSGNCSWDAAGGISGAAARATGPLNACLMQSIAVNPGDVYAVGAWSRNIGAGRAYLQVRWLDGNKRWTLTQEERVAYFPEIPGEWGSTVRTITVPEGASWLVVCLATDLPSSADSCWFDNVEVYKLW